MTIEVTQGANRGFDYAPSIDELKPTEAELAGLGVVFTKERDE